MSLDELVRDELEASRALYFEAILPRYIDLHHRGAGYAFVYALLADHDVVDILKILERPEPSLSAIQRSRATERLVDIGAR